MKYIISLILLIIVLSGCSSEKEWTAFVYPDIEDIPSPDQAENYIVGKHDTFESCQQAAINLLRYNNEQSGKQGDYQCGYECTHKKEYGNLLVCEEMKK